MRRVTVTMVALTLLASAVPGPATAATPTDNDIAYAQAFRESMGLKAGDAYVRSSLESSSGFSSEDWGVRLTQAESNELFRRAEAVEAAGPTTVKASEMDGYAGVYMDHDRGGILVYQFASGRNAAENALAKSMPGSVDYEVKAVEYSLDELDAASTKVLAREARVDELGMDIVGIRYDIPGNQIQVGINGSPDRAKEAIGSIAGPVSFRAEQAGIQDCSNLTNCPKAKGGIRINDGTFCTATAVGKRTDPAQHRVLITAGHCLQYNSSGTWTHNGATVGSDEGRIWTASSTKPYPVIKSDIGIIDLAGGFLPSSGNNNKFIIDDANGGVEKYGSVGTAPTGTPICTIGAGSKQKGWSPKRCGVISAYYIDNLTCKNQGTTPPCAKVDFTVEVDFDSTGGDSGAPYWVNTGSSPFKLIGIHTHSTKDGANPRSNGKYGWYAPITRGLTYLSQKNPPINVFVCTNGDCNP